MAYCIKLGMIVNFNPTTKNKRWYRKYYWIAKDIDQQKAVLKKINEAINTYEDTGHFELPSHGRNSIVFDTISWKESSWGLN